jgi:hypothetical protein
MKSISLLFFIILASCTVQAQSKGKFTKADELKLSSCNCDSIYKAWPPKPGGKVEAPEFTGEGWNRLYNFQNKVGQCGYFSKFYFIYGLHFKYDLDGNLIKINKFFNGKLVGTCDLKKK